MAASTALVPAIERAVAILDLVAESDRPLRLADIVARSGLPKSSVHGQCQTLCALGLLHLMPEGFGIGVKASVWAAAFDQKSVLLNAFRQALEAMPGLARYALTLSVREGGEVVYLACRNSDAPLGLTFRVGMRLPAVYTATGKAFLAHLPREELAACIGPWPRPFTAQGVRDLAALTRQLDGVRASGIGVDDGELREGMICLAAPIFSASGKALAAVSLSLTAVECPPEGRAEHEAVIRALAADIAARVHGSV